MRLMKFNFICPVCDKLYFTYVEQKHYQDMINGVPVEENFKGYPEYYQRLIRTSICQECQDVHQDSVCSEDSSKDDEELYVTIEQLEYAAGRAI